MLIVDMTEKWRSALVHGIDFRKTFDSQNIDPAPLQTQEIWHYG